MKTRKLWALPGVLLALCLILALPAAAVEAEAPEAEVPAAALEAEVPAEAPEAEAPAAETGKTVRVTCTYPQNLCTFTVRVPNTEQTWPLDSDIPYDEGKDYVWLAFEIGDIAGGYRIKRVRMDGGDRTESFVNGGYGGMATYIRADTAIQVELEEIPDSLPSVAGVRLYTDEALTREAEEHISYEAGSTGDRLYGKGTYSDGGDYPSYYATGQWEFSTDGVTWRPTRTWGSNRWDFWPGWQYHTELDFVSASYDIRLRVTPNDRYTGGGEVLSNVVHVNGGARKPSGGGGGGSLAVPADLRWGTDAEGNARPGCMSWTAGADRDFLSFDIRVLDSAGELVYEQPGESCVTNGQGRWCSMFLSCLDEGLLPGGALLPGGDYRFQVRATQNNELVSEWSEVSGVYHYTQPAERLEAPSGARWAGLYPLMAWTAAADGETAFDYYVRYYFSPDDGEAEDPSGLKDASGTLHMSLDGNGVTSNAVFVEEMMKREGYGAGYYYFTVQAISGDRDQYLNSPESPLSDAVYFDGQRVTNGGSGAVAAVSQVKVQEGKLTFTVSSTNATWGENEKNGSLFLAGWRNGVLSDAAYTTKSGGDFSLNGETATVFFLEEGTWIPLAEAVRVTVPAA